MSLVEIDDERYYPILLLVVSLIALVLLGASYFVEVRVIVEKPRYGDVTEPIRAFWRAILGVTTVGSFLIGVYTFVGDSDDSSGPPTKAEIKGTGHDIDVYPTAPAEKRDDETGSEERPESEDEAETESNGDAKSENDEAGTPGSPSDERAID